MQTRGQVDRVLRKLVGQELHEVGAGLLRPQRMVVVVTAGSYDEESQSDAPRAFLDAVLEATGGDR